MAEGFVQEQRGRRSEEVAEEYLTKLVHRNLVQVNLNGMSKTFSVHDLVREVILSNSEELGFCHISTDCSTLQGIARHLSIINREGDNPKSRVKSQTRSLMVFSRKELQKPIIDAIFEKCKLLTTLDFESYARGSSVKELRVEINRFSKLRYLLGLLKIHGSIEHLEFLQVLDVVRLDDNQGLRLINELRMLKQLRKLGIVNFKRDYGRDLCTALERMTQLRSLYLRVVNGDEILELFDGYNGEKIHFEEGGFQKLKTLLLARLNELKTMTIDKGAMPLIESLAIGPCPQLKEVPSGIQHLKHLNELYFAGMSSEFTQRLSREQGEDYWIVKNVPI
ncbi:unnamed protein product, partial [Dovyalis caffra]